MRLTKVTHMTKQAAGLLVMFVVSFVGTAQGGTSQHYREYTYAETGEQRSLESPLAMQLYKALGGWSKAPTTAGAAQCQEMASQLVRTGEPSTDAYYESAQVLELTGNAKQAIVVLEELLQKRPDGWAPGGVRASVQQSTNLWRGRLKANIGDIAGVRDAFAEARVELEGWTLDEQTCLSSILCQLEAESQPGLAKTSGQDISEDFLRQKYIVPLIQRGDQSAPYAGMFVDWMAEEGLLVGTAKTEGRVAPVFDLGMAGLALSGPLEAVGILNSSSDRLEVFWNGDSAVDRKYNLLGKYLEKERSRYVRSLILWKQAFTAFEEQPQAAHLERSLQKFKECAAEAPILTPWAELGIAACLESMGRKTEALAELDKIAATWPSYTSVTAEAKDRLGKVQQPPPESPQPIPTAAPSPAVAPMQAPVAAVSPPVEAGNSHVVFVVLGAMPVLLLVALGVWFWLKANSAKRP